MLPSDYFFLTTGTTTGNTEFYFMMKQLDHFTYRAQCTRIFRHSHHEDWIEILNQDATFLMLFQRAKYSGLCRKKIAPVKINWSSCFSVTKVNGQVDTKQLHLRNLSIREDTVTERLDYLFNTGLIPLSPKNSCWSFQLL